ncbi:MAG: patatin-like phospholipase family protein [Actinomycetota bacterium]|nr:patatin-like phospholipase family protein [Actinomycetota bacterium]
MAENSSERRVAIACQGGGSHTAFTAGVLERLLREKKEGRHDYEIVALSGTSGGSICALLAWYGLLTNDTDKAIELLGSFWRDNSASSPWESLLNDWLLQTNRFFGNIGGTPTVSPYSTYASTWARDQLKCMLERHVDFGRIQDLVKPSSPMLLIGAVDVLSGDFKAFSSRRDTINVEMVLASAALPTLFKAVHADGGVYWDGLFSQNPPVRELPDAKPHEIWVIQVDPQKRSAEPTTMPHIMDRRNELAGNLSLRQETYFIEKINEWVKDGSLSGTKHEVIELKWIEMLRDLDAESKLDRSPSFIRGMKAYGEEQAEAFLRKEFLGGPVAGVGPRSG